MSLINEALKRAEQDKLRNIAPTNYMSTLPPVHEARRKRFSVPVAGVLIVAILLVGAFAAWRLIGRDSNSGTPTRANAAIVPTAAIPPSAPAAVPTEPVTTAPPAPAKEHVSVGPLSKTPPQELLSVKSGLEAIAGAGKAVKEVVDKIGDVLIPAAPAAKPAVEPQETPKVAAKPKEAPAAAKPEPQPEPKKPAIPRAIDYSRYRLTGVMQSSDGGIAIINGCFVKTGQTVDDAKVVKIQENSVLLEIDGEKFTIRM